MLFAPPIDLQIIFSICMILSKEKILSKDFGRAQLIWVVGCCWNRQFRMTRLRDYEKKLRAVCQTAKNWAAVLL